MDPVRSQRRGFRAFSWPAAAATACVALSIVVSGAWASSLTVKGPPGSVVFIDGEPRGTLPLETPIELAPGEYRLRCEMPGYVPHEETIVLQDPGHELSVTVRLVRRRRSTAVAYSLVLAGLGQHYQGNHRRGWTLMAIQLGAVAGAIYGESRFKNHRSDYEDAYRLYQDSVDAEDIARYRTDANRAYSDMESAESLRNTALWITAATGLFAAIEAWIAHPKLVVSSDRPEPSSQGALDVNLQVGWRTQF